MLLLARGLVVGEFLAVLAAKPMRMLRREGREGGGSTGRLIYDADCGFCTRSARWLTRRRPDRVHIVPWQALPDLASLGLSEGDVRERAYWQDPSGTLCSGSAAIAAAMVARGGPAAGAGRMIVNPLVAPAAARVYRWVAANRYQMPGSTDACRVKEAGQTGRQS